MNIYQIVFFPQVFMKTERRLFFNDFSYNYK